MSYQLFIKDKNLVPENIKKGVTILKVTGTMEGSRTVTLQSKTVDSSTEKQTVTYDSGYDGLKDVTVEAYELDAKTVNSSTSQQVITSDKDGLSSVTVNAVTSSIDGNIQAGNIKKDVTILGVTGTYESSPALQSKTVDVSTHEQVVTPDQGYDGLSSVTVNNVTGIYEIDQYTYNQSSFYRSVYDKALVHYYDPKVAAKTVDPSTSQQTFNPLNEQVQFYNGITVNAVDASIDSNIQAGNIKKDVTILGVTGTLEEGGGVNNQNKTVSSSTSNQTVTYDSGYTGLGTVTVNKYTLDSKTVNSSTSQQVITSDVDGLSSVTVNPYTLDSKTVDPSTSQQTVNSSVNGLSSVTVNAVTSSIDGNIQAGNIKKDVSILGVVGTYEGSGSGSDWILDVRAGNISDLSSHKMDAPSVNNQYSNLFIRCEIDQLPDMSDWTSISGSLTCENMFKDASSSNTGNKIADLSSLTALSGSSSVYNMFYNSKITELWLPNLSTIFGGCGLENIIGPAEASTLKTLKINVAVAQPYGFTAALTGSSNLAGVQNIEMTGMATKNLNFTYMSSLTADSVLSILTHLGVPTGSKSVNFANGGLTITDYPDGRIQAAYDDAVNARWTINNLTITPFDDAGLFQCPECGGTGYMNGEPCETCGGSGYVDWDPNPPQDDHFECPDCGGTGFVDNEPCETCGGSGYVDWDPTE
jgi:hypothetical protein